MTKRTIGCATSINIVQQQSYSTSSLHGVKCASEHIEPNISHREVLEDVTNFSVGEHIRKRQRTDDSWKNHIEASKINAAPNNQLKCVPEHARRNSVTSTPGPSQNPLLSLSHARYGLPETLVKNFASLGINSIYPWQSSCLLGHGILSGEKNLVYTAPTGGGKSLVADVLMLRRIIQDPSKKAILVLPYVALVQEKLKWLRKVVEGVQKSAGPLSQAGSQLPKWRRPYVSSIRVAGFFGGSRSGGSWNDVDVAICTIEKVYRSLSCNEPILTVLKANALVNTATEECTTRNLGIVVLDELHMITDNHRGFLMEIMASKLLVLDSPVQIVGMSATLTVFMSSLYMLPCLTRIEHTNTGQMAWCKVLQYQVCASPNR